MRAGIPNSVVFDCSAVQAMMTCFECSSGFDCMTLCAEPTDELSAQGDHKIPHCFIVAGAACCFPAQGNTVKTPAAEMVFDIDGMIETSFAWLSIVRCCGFKFHAFEYVRAKRTDFT